MFCNGFDGWIQGSAAGSSGVEVVALAEGEGVDYSIDPTITGRYDGTSGSLATRVDAETLESLYAGPLKFLIKPGPAEPTDDEELWS